MHYLDARSNVFGAPPGQRVPAQPQQTQVLNPQMTTAKCMALCAAHNMPFKGVTAAGQCSCGKPVQEPPSTPAPGPVTVVLGPPPKLSEVDCVGLPHPYNGGRELPSDFMKRLQQALNYAQPTPKLMPVPITGVFDFLTLAAWTWFVQRYGTWDSFTQQYIGSDLNSITCDGVMLLKKTNDQIYASQQAFIGPLDAGTPGGSVTVPAPSGQSAIQYDERDKLWLVAPASRPALRRALANLTHTVTRTGTQGTIFARCQPSSAPIPLGQDALTKLRAKIAAGYAAMIWTKSDFSQVVIGYTNRAAIIAVNCSTAGSLKQARAGGALNAFGIDPSQGTQRTPPSSPILANYDPSQASTPTLPDPTTGLPAWALYEGEPPTLIDAARALFTVTGGTPSPVTQPTPPSGYPPAGYPYPAPAPAPAPAAPAVSPSWVKPLAIAGGIGLAAYFVLR